jgi:hypothetical protein
LACCGGIEAPHTPSIGNGKEIQVRSVRVESGRAISVSGLSTLPEDTCIHTQLHADGTPVDWWPNNRCATIADESWELTVALGQAGAPEGLDPGVEYVVHAWQEGAPAVETRFPFDLAAPPAD